MIAWTYIHSAQLDRIKGVFDGIDYMTIPCKITRRQALTDEVIGPEIRYEVYNRILVIRLEDLETLTDRCNDFGIKGFRWVKVKGEKYREYAYRSQSGGIVFRIGHMRSQRRFEPDGVSA